MKNKGYTLIELLGVLILLAIISLIAIPNIVNVIKDSKESTTEENKNMYIKAVRNKAYELELKGETLSGNYDILSDGNICIDGTKDSCSRVLNLELSGQKPTGGNVSISGGEVRINEIEYR